MRTGRSYVATAIALGIITLSGCAAETADEGNGPKSNEDWGDPEKYPEIGGAYHSLTAFSGTCTFTSGTMTVTATAVNDQSIIIGKRAVDSAILVNGALVSGCTTATSATLKQLKVTATTGNQVVVLDFLGGLFAPGIATARGIIVDLGAGASDEVRIRGTSAVDSWVFGSDGMALNTDAFRDIDFTGVELLNFSLGAGNDILTGTVIPAGLGAGKGVAATAILPFTAFGGDGNDVITGGAHSDVVYGGPGADTLSGGGNGTNPGGAAGSETDWLAGQEGADVITQADSVNGKDIIACGTELPVDNVVPALADTVTYALRGTAAVRAGTEATQAAMLLVDGERVGIALGICTDLVNNVTGAVAPDTVCDVDAKGFDIYPATNGHIVETGAVAGGLWVVATTPVTELDAISADCETIVGSQDNDLMVGGPENETISGGLGDDVLTGGLGDDVLNGDDGADTFLELTVDSGSDIFNGGAGVDVVDYSARLVSGVEVTMDGVDANDGFAGEEDNIEADVENLLGTGFADKLTGNALANVLRGGAGIDEYDGAAGNDTFDEGYLTSGADKFVGGAGTDTVDYSKRGFGVWVTAGDATANDGQATTLPTTAVATQAAIVALVESATGGASSEGDDVGDDVENVLGSLVNDYLVGNDSNNLLDGGPGSDFLFGGAGDDVLFGGAAGVADETVYATVDFDVPVNGTFLNTAAAVVDGDDYLYGGEGADTLDGSGFTITTGGNKLVCGAGDDVSVNQGSVTFVSTTGVGSYRDAATCES